MMDEENFGDAANQTGNRIEAILAENLNDTFQPNGDFDLIRLVTSNKDLSNHLNTLRNIYA